ncbi:hypothetical protein CEUSTIGMA_g4749.t1 [Chlamydomonas eustigma]|uniref:Golgi apparatus protein 1 n=1 Tax=Chlamydomonas eustigma TaxID=1157962 RepID=A0A250X2I3_9CHLO|nr:hypothetical protein CEUSTIGMA_g4749.t1 [Chlamydomonas eustigma]|eukprot:GAX77303.1 hypothetical protein CEUSTIGMA_g4749.t1 [Chlamydomonas eustigma]
MTRRNMLKIACLCIYVVLLVDLVNAANEQVEQVVKASEIIKSAGAANLANGNGDVSPAGACAGDVKAFCKDVGPGEGRIASCLTKRIRAQKQGNVVGRKVSNKCSNELALFKIDRSSNINKDVPLARACKDDVEKLCKGISDETPGSILGCLRDNKNKIGGKCKTEVFRTQQEVSEDYRLDYKLYNLCKDDVKNLCADVEPGDNREVECLDSKRQHVTWDCQAQLYRNEKEAGDDIRLSVRLFSKCLGDYEKFCSDVEPGHMRVQECLEDNMEDSKFSSECKEELDDIIAKRVTDFKLDTTLREACESDLQDMCATTLKAMDDDNKVKRSALNCLQQYKEELKSEKCQAEVHRRTKRAARDIRFDEVLADACQEDRTKFCNDVQMGSARVIRCLQEHRSSLAQKCAAAMFDHEVQMAEDIDFKYPMKKACAWEISTFCKDIPHGHARVVRCLQDNIENTDMSKECKDEVTRDNNRMGTDYRLNYRLNHACESDISRLCSNMCSTTPGSACGGLVLQCLQDKQDNITSQTCQDEVFYYELMEVSDFRNDVILAEACRTDVEAYCKDTEPGEGRVHTCLRFNKDKISERCRNEEMKLAALEYRDIRLRPKLNKMCSEEKAVYCKDVKPGKARVVKCLMENMAQPNFGEECKEELQKREDVMKSDYRYDIGVFTSCKADVDAHCADAKNKLRGNATVLKCLVDNFRSVSEACQTEMSRAVRIALWDYKPGAGLTMACDADVSTQCPRGSRSKSGAVFTIGVVGRCLSKSLVEGKRLEPKCRDLVLVAAPKDARAYFDYPESTSALIKRVAELQQIAGLNGVLVAPGARGGSAVTVTGWVALACIVSLVVVIIGGTLVVYRRFIGVDKPHTMHVKMGDA